MQPSPSEPAAKNSFLTPKVLAPLAVVILIAVAWFAHKHNAFDWHGLAHQLHAVSPPIVLSAVALSYLGYWLRAWRWSILLSPLRRSTTRELFPAQLIGFTMVGLFGRVADLARPYLIARRTQTTVASQLALYSIERAFDLAAAAILFSTTLAFAPRNMPHHEAFARAGIVSLAATLFLAAFALALRFAGARVSTLAAKLLRPLSPSLAEKSATHILSFSAGMAVIANLRELLILLLLSIVMWLGIAFTYLQCAHAFLASSQLATLSFAATMLLLATSMGGSLFQLPILGWFTQIALLAAALHGFFAVPLETATACGTVLLVALNLVVVPAGLIAARMQGITLSEASRTS